MSSYTYLDYAATSPLRPEALDAMMPYLAGEDPCGLSAMNPNSLHTPGREAFKALEASRKKVACALEAARPSEIVFTSGATEADNAALQGIAAIAGKEMISRGAKPHIIVSSIEHDAVRRCAKKMARANFEVTFLDPDRDGFIECRALQDAIRDETVLVSVQMANSETGAIQPISQLADVAHSRGAYFHTDATQALGKCDVRLGELGVDAASFSSHKIGGPRGFGALYLRNGVPFEATMWGGGQETDRRSGTQDVASSVGFSVACALAVSEMDAERDRLTPLRDKLYKELATFDEVQPTVEVEPSSRDYLCNIANFMFRGIESETAVMRFDSLGFAVSGGSACSSRSLKASHVLTSMGIPTDQALGEVRVSMGSLTTKDDVNAFLSSVPKVIHWESRKKH